MIRDHRGETMNNSVNINNINELLRVLCLPGCGVVVFLDIT
jgi:hypothetical protein